MSDTAEEAHAGAARNKINSEGLGTKRNRSPLSSGASRKVSTSLDVLKDWDHFPEAARFH